MITHADDHAVMDEMLALEQAALAAVQHSASAAREQAVRRRSGFGYAFVAMLSTVETRACMSPHRYGVAW